MEEEIKRLKAENELLKGENEQKNMFKEKYIEVIGKLTNLSKTDNPVAVDDTLLNNADDVVEGVVSSFAALPSEQKTIPNIHK